MPGWQPTRPAPGVHAELRRLDLGELWARATDDERTEIAQNLFASLRVRDGLIVSAKLARDEYLPLIASAEARVWMARPEGFEPPTC